jgi:hypothetical protein
VRVAAIERTLDVNEEEEEEKSLDSGGAKGRVACGYTTLAGEDDRNVLELHPPHPPDPITGAQLSSAYKFTAALLSPCLLPPMLPFPILDLCVPLDIYNHGFISHPIPLWYPLLFTIRD